MKKNFSLALVALALMFVGCEDEPEPTPNPGNDDAVSVVGTWVNQKDYDVAVLTLNADSTYEWLTDRRCKTGGTYSYANNTLTIRPTITWAREGMVDENGNLHYTEWREIPTAQYTFSCEVRMIYSGDVLMYQHVTLYEGDTSRIDWSPYVNTNATHVSNINDIQGKWYWMFEGTPSTPPHPLAIINIDGTDGDIIYTHWGERYIGTVRYEKGVIYMDDPTFYTTWYEDGNGFFSHTNLEDPESSPWQLPDPDIPYSIGRDKLAIGFVVDENVGYGGIEDQVATFTRQ